ncbi:MAG: hypothetical protein ACD_76C00039G0004 [uncultured bacterium]|nr:MAG: hypothetical protein ACD_76C00039G0004 [uncultured bacterium]HBD05774.1 hypothetical protein [Candidatus Uhrbacteria bacterium]
MDQATIDQLKQKLQEEAEKLKKELMRFSKPAQGATETDFQSDFPNLGDKDDENASEVASFSDRLSLENELEKSLQDVESALKRIEGGTYGVCKYCGSEIDLARLQARPAASSCIQCKKTLTQEV